MKIVQGKKLFHIQIDFGHFALTFGQSLRKEMLQTFIFKLFIENNNSFWLELQNITRSSQTSTLNHHWPKVNKENKTKYRLKVLRLLILVATLQELIELLLIAQISILNWCAH